MSILQLNKDDINMVRCQWMEVMAKNQYQDEDVVGTMFSCLLSDHPSLKLYLNTPYILQEQKRLFSEMIKFSMMYLHDLPLLDECIEEFAKENSEIVQLGSKYLEPMGASLIQTLRGTLSPKEFNTQVENLWIKVYVYVANAILQYCDSDVDSCMSDANLSSASEDEILPLSIKKPPSSCRNLQHSQGLDKSSKEYINILLSSNEKYKGFRRSITENPQTPLLIRIPENLRPSTDNELKAFKPTNYKSSPKSEPCKAFGTNEAVDHEEAMLTPRSSKRNTTAQLISLGLGEIPNNSMPFDPRRRSHKRNFSLSEISSLVLAPESLVSEGDATDSCSEAGSDPAANIDFRPQLQPRAPVFDYDSFRIKGLAPIAESDQDDEGGRSMDDRTSSIYEERNEKSSDEEYSSSRTSSLSLHHLGYKSSISSGSGNSNYEKSPKMSFSPMSKENPISLGTMKLPLVMHNNAYLTSLPSFNTRICSGLRASAGFMKSSFILRKEMMKEKGYKIHESNCLYTDIPTGYVPKCLSSMSLPCDRKKSIAVTNLDPDYNGSGSVCVSLASDKIKRKDSFRKKLGSFFSSRKLSKSEPTSDFSEKPTESFGVPSAQEDITFLQTNPYTQNSSFQSSHRVSSLDVRLEPPSFEPRGYAGSVYLKSRCSDNISTFSVTSEKSRLSFFRRNKIAGQSAEESAGRKGNKYYVKKVPFKTIYVKDLVK